MKTRFQLVQRDNSSRATIMNGRLVILNSVLLIVHVISYFCFQLQNNDYIHEIYYNMYTSIIQINSTYLPTTHIDFLRK